MNEYGHTYDYKPYDCRHVTFAFTTDIYIYIYIVGNVNYIVR